MAHGKQICIDYTGCNFDNLDGGKWMLQIMQYAVEHSKVREVHAHVEEFDGTKSPPGFAAVVLLDESHVSAHCYYDNGLLAVDAFTCGESDPNLIINTIHEILLANMENIKQVSRNQIDRFKS